MPPDSDKTMPLRSRYMYVCIFLCAFALRYGYCMHTDYTELANDERVYNRLARVLLEQHTFICNGEDSNRPPLYPAFIATMYACTGSSLYAVIFMQCILGALTCLCIAGAAGKITGSHRWAWAGGWLSAGYYGLIHMPASLLTETLVTFWLALGIWLVIDNPRSLFKNLLAGMVFGLAALTRGNFLILPVLAIGWYVWRRVKLGHSLVAGMLFMAGCFLIIAPWTARNYSVHRSFVPVNIQTGIVFWGAHNPLARGGWADPATVSDDMARTLRSYARLPLPERDRQYVREGLHYLQELSGAEKLRLAGLKIYWLLFPSITVYDVTFVMLAPFMLAGFVRHASGGNVLCSVLAAGVLTTLIFYGSPRFRGPLSPALIVFAVLGLRWYFSRLTSHTRAAGICGAWTALNAAVLYLEAVVDYDFGLF
jgi:4-amino-4-deoxy-L-arabinose transferase-like glycosyltransferase